MLNKCYTQTEEMWLQHVKKCFDFKIIKKKILHTLEILYFKNK